MTLELCPTCNATGRFERHVCIKCLGSGLLEHLPLSGLTVAHCPLESFPEETRWALSRLRAFSEGYNHA